MAWPTADEPVQTDAEVNTPVVDQAPLKTAGFKWGLRATSEEANEVAGFRWGVKVTTDEEVQSFDEVAGFKWGLRAQGEDQEVAGFRWGVK